MVFLIYMLFMAIMLPFSGRQVCLHNGICCLVQGCKRTFFGTNWFLGERFFAFVPWRGEYLCNGILPCTGLHGGLSFGTNWILKERFLPLFLGGVNIYLGEVNIYLMDYYHL